MDTSENSAPREAVSRAFGIAAMAVAVSSPLLAPLLDRWEPRRLVLFCFAVSAAAFASLGLLVPGIVGNGTARMGFSGAGSSRFVKRRGLLWIAGERAKEPPSMATPGHSTQRRLYWEHGKTAMGVTFETVKQVGLAMAGVEAGTSYGSPALKVRGKLLACIPANREAEPGSLVVRMDPADRAELLLADPALYYVTDHYAGYAAVLVRMQHATPEIIRDLLGVAHKFVTGKR